ncbi:putative ubiquitin-like-specific protease 1B [Miscanthus floridulus]|uniref:putative ubiquitin-like-specific protease 1B n=1 Tax=Miscanthus floridulus TaxID=154761 RepID=UPI0034594A05
MKRDGEKDETIEANYPNRDTSQRSGLVQRVLAYLKHDMVFLSINVTNTHWYLAVINAVKREVQVLDSLGEMFGCRARLRKQIDFILEDTGPKEHKWLDVEVDTWPVREIFRRKLLQTDGFSCGLFLINFMEYWTGNDLSDEFNRDDMKEFRLKLAAILLLLELNKRKVAPYLDRDENIESPSDCAIIENP